MRLLVLSIFSLISWGAYAAPQALTYQGRVVNVDGKPLQYNNVSFQFEITTANGSCVLYREQVNGVDMTNSNGVFDVKIGASHSYPASPSFTILDSFNNAGSLVCDGGTVYNPTVNDGRLLRVQFHDGSAWRLISPDSIIRSVPYAAYAASSNKLGSYFAADFILKSEVNGNATCSGGSYLTWNATTQTFGCEADSGGGGGSGTVTEILSSNSYLTVANATTTPTLTLNVGTSVNTVAAGNDPRFTNARTPTGSAGGDLGGSYPNPSVAKIQGVGIDFSTPPNLGEVLTFDGANWISQTLPAASSGTVTSITAGTGLTGGAITTSGTIGLGAALSGLNSVATNGYIQRTGAGTYSTTTGSVAASNNNLVLRDGSGVSSFYGVGIAGATSGQVTLQAPLIAGTYSLTLPDAQGAANQVMANDGSGILSWINVPSAPGAACGAGNVLTYNGTAFTCVPDQVGSAGGGIATLNSQTGSSQSFANGSAGNLPNWSSNTDVHTLNIPFARTAGVTAGLISKTEYDTFNSKQNALAYTPLAPANNLSELTDIAVARTNLGLGSAAVKNAPSSGNAALTEVVLGDDTRLTNSRAPSGTAGGDLGGTYPNPDVNRIKGVGLSITSLTTGNFLKYNGTNWINTMIDPSDITGLVTSLGSKIDQSQIVGPCTSSKTLVFSSVSGSWTCTDIAVAGTQVTYASQTANTFFAAPSGGAGAPTFRTIAAADLPSAVSNALWSLSGSNIYRSSGSVAVGTTDPTFGLTFDTNVRNFSVTGSGTESASSLGSIAVGNNRPTATVGDYLGNFDFVSVNNGASTRKLGARIQAVLTGAGGVGGFGADLTFFTKPDNTPFAVTHERLRITSDGSVGIGTATPTDRLQVVDSVDGQLAIAAQNNSTGTSAYAAHGSVSDGAGINMEAYSSTSTGTWGTIARADSVTLRAHTGRPPANMLVGTSTAVPLHLMTSATPRLTILGSGNVGIGTTSPGEELEVVGQVKVSAGAPYIQLNETDTNKQWFYGADSNQFWIREDTTAGTNQRFTILPGGNVGIGTATPSQSLTVVETSDVTGIDAGGAVLIETTAGHRLRIDSNEMQSSLNGAASGLGINPFGGYTTIGGSAGLTVKDGLVGIGSTSPASKLAVGGAGNATYQFSVTGQTATSSTYGIVHRDSAGTTQFYTRDDGVMYSAGPAGIGIGASTSYALRLGGNLYVQGTGVNCIVGTGTGGTSCTSDARLKDNVTPISKALEKVLQLRGVEFDWNKNTTREGRHAVGVIAQEVEKVFPTLVSVEPNSGYRVVDYAGLVSPLIESTRDLYGMCQSQQKDISEQKRKLASLEEELEREKKRNDELEKRLQAIEILLQAR